MASDNENAEWAKSCVAEATQFKLTLRKRFGTFGPKMYDRVELDFDRDDPTELAIFKRHVMAAMEEIDKLYK